MPTRVAHVTAAVSLLRQSLEPGAFSISFGRLGPGTLAVPACDGFLEPRHRAGSCAAAHGLQQLDEALAAAVLTSICSTFMRRACVAEHAPFGRGPSAAELSWLRLGAARLSGLAAVWEASDRLAAGGCAGAAPATSRCWWFSWRVQGLAGCAPQLLDCRKHLPGRQGLHAARSHASKPCSEADLQWLNLPAPSCQVDASRWAWPLLHTASVASCLRCCCQAAPGPVQGWLRGQSGVASSSAAQCGSRHAGPGFRVVSPRGAVGHHLGAATCSAGTARLAAQLCGCCTAPAAPASTAAAGSDAPWEAGLASAGCAGSSGCGAAGASPSVVVFSELRQAFASAALLSSAPGAAAC